MNINGRTFRMIILFIWTVVALVLFTSCATKTKIEYVDREVVKYQTQIVHDTTINNVHDSIYYSVIQKGDTVFSTKYVEHIKWKERIVYQCDTLMRDSIEVQIKENTIEKTKIPKWCYYSLAVCLLFIIFAIYKIVRWLQTV